MADTARLELPLLAPEQALKHITHNEALEILDTVAQLVVEELDRTDPPGAPEAGEVYGIGSPASGDWTGRDGQLACWTGNGWRFIGPAAGWAAWNRDTGRFHVHTGSGWTFLAAALGALHNVPQLGVNATADAINRLAVRSNAALFNALDTGSGGNGDMRLTLNMETAADTASLVYQAGFSARAEMGLAGTENFSVKVSPDGAAFTTALSIERGSGFVRLERLFGSAPSFPVISAGVLTVTTSYAVPAPESGASDTVDTITGGEDGAILVLTGTAGNALTFADGTGNLKLGGARVLDNFEDSLMLVKRGTDWIELSYSNNG